MNPFNQETASQVMEQAFPAFVMALGLTLEDLGKGRAVVRLPFSAPASRQDGIISGQALAALADTAMVCAMWADLGEPRPVATVDLHVSYLRAAKEEDLLAVAEVVKTGRSISFARVSIASPSSPDRPVATAVATFAMA